jgi:hypothetical protein
MDYDECDMCDVICDRVYEVMVDGEPAFVCVDCAEDCDYEDCEAY